MGQFKKWRMWSLVHEGPKKKIFFRKKVIYPPHSLYNRFVNKDVDKLKSYKKYLIKKSKKSFNKLFTSIKRYDNIILSIRYWLKTITL